MNSGRSITLPFNYKPRDYQLPLLRAIDSGKNRAVWVAHRRSGKDVTAINIIAKKMFERVGAYYYLFPSYSQGKKILWNGMNRDGFKFLDYIPKELRKRTNNSEMIIETVNGSLMQVVGTDNMDSIVGTNPVGCVFSEYSLQDPAAWDYIRPILAENGGWAIFVYTPRGKNHGWDLLETARAYPEQWFSQVLTVEDTKAIDFNVLEQERAEIIRQNGNDAFYHQEYMCSFEVPIQGAYYAQQMMQALDEGRICSVPYDPNALVDTYWDLGIRDSMSIWFLQTIGKELHLIDYYESSGEGLNHYIQVLKDRNYIYGKHGAPHDIQVRELSTGKSRLEVAEALGISFEPVPMLPIDDGIQAVRNILSRCWFDKVKCDRGIQALRSYHKDWDEKNQVWSTHAAHDWASHGSDSFRMLAVGYKEAQQSLGAVENYVSLDPY